MRLTSSEMREIDRYTIEEIGIEERKLMELAGLQIAELVRNKFSPQKVRVFAGKGNNGGDGIVAARKLEDYGFEPVISVIGEPREIPAEELQVMDRLDVERIDYQQKIDADIILDSIFGYSVKGNPRPPYNSVIQLINSSGAEVISVDVPSGLDPETGEKGSPTVKPDFTVALAAPKNGIDRVEGEKYLADIGIPAEAYSSEGFEKPREFREKSLVLMEK